MIGERLGPYEILEKLGQGGMGEVWKARDTALEREVAIKVLPDLFAGDPERLARFEREAKLLASLSHPGIAAVHGLHEQDGQRFLAMEFVPGEDLSERLRRGPLGLDEALFVGVQVAEALEAAHAQGVIHRDLKPANIMIAPDGRAKVLDFGLAKALESTGSGSASLSPTMTGDGTAAGMILGTAAYMSPEQSRARPLDRRTDVWSFGCVLFECLTGSSLFRGETVSDSLGAILHKEPDWSLLPDGTPPTVRLLLRRCLAKDRDRRLHDIADARIELEQAIEDPSSSSMGLAGEALDAGDRVRRPPGWLLPAAAAAALAGGLAAGWLLRGAPEPAPFRKLDLGVELVRGPDPAEAAISPDGGQVAYTHQGRLWVQALDTLAPRALEGTGGAIAPFWSPDGDEIGYFAGGKLWRISPAGRGAVAICDVGGDLAGGRGASWGGDGRIVFSRGNSGILAVPALGGQPAELVALGEEDGDFHEPALLPDGRGSLFVVHPKDASPGVLAVFRDGERRLLIESESGQIHSPRYAPSGHILFRWTNAGVTEGIWALPFSLDRFEAGGDPFLVVADAASASVSEDGTLAFVHRPALSGRDQLLWVDRAGRPLEPIGPDRRGSSAPSLSPDGRRLAFAALDDEDDMPDLWVRDLERGTETRLTVDSAFEFSFFWSASGEELLFSHFDPDSTTLATFLVSTDGSGAPRPLLERGVADGFAGDGRWFLATRLAEGEPLSQESNTDLWLMPLREEDEPRMLVGGPDREVGGRLSPDGRWLAYQSERSTRTQVYLTRFPETTRRWQVSAGEGEEPRWDPRGDRLYFREGDNLMQVTVGSGDEPELGRPTLLFELPRLDRQRGYEPSADGERFIVAQNASTPEDEDAARSGIKIVQNWIREFEE